MKERNVKKGTSGTDKERGHKRSTEHRTGSVSFVLTLWVEPREVEADPEWRWKVRHVQTDEQAHFTRIADVLAFVASHSGVAAPR